MNKKNLLVLILFLLLNLIPHIYASRAPSEILLNWYLTDDAFYYFKTAQNIAESKGITFDGIATTNGFHPLWMSICVPVFLLARINLYLPLRVLIVIQSLLNAGSGYLLFRIFADEKKPITGWLVACFWMFTPSIHSVTTKLGLESSINAFSIFFLIYMVSIYSREHVGRKRNLGGILWISLASVIALLSRLDNIFIVLMIGIWLVFLQNQMRWMAQVDFLLILLSVITSYFLRIQSTDNLFNFLPFAYLLIVSSLIIKPIVFYFFGLYRFEAKRSLKSKFLSVFMAVALSSLLIAGLHFLVFDVLHLLRGWSRAVLILDFLITLIGVGVLRTIYWNQCNRVGCENEDISFRGNIAGWSKRALAYFLPLFSVLMGYMLFNRSYAGTAMPVSGQIKRWWGKLPNSVYGQPLKSLDQIVGSFFSVNVEKGPFWLITRPMHWLADQLVKFLNISGLSSENAYVFMLWFVWIVFFSIVATIVIQNHQKFQQTAKRFALLPLFTGILFHVLSYQATGYLHTKHWYWIGEMIFMVVFFGILLAMVFEKDRMRDVVKKIYRIGVMILCSLLFVNLTITIYRGFGGIGQVKGLYQVEQETTFIELYTKEGDVIGMTGGGLLGYFVPDRVIVNLDGLINGGRYFEMLKDGKADEYLSEINVQYIYGDETVLLDSDPYRWMLTDRLHLKAIGPIFRLYEYCPQTCQQD